MRRHLLLHPLPLNCADPGSEESATEQESEQEEEEEHSQPPTNISIVEWKQKKKEKQERIAREKEELREQEEQERREQKLLEECHGSRKKKKKKKKQRELDSEEEDSRKSIPYSEEFLHSQKHQRVLNHPSIDNMSGRPKRGRTPAKISVGSSQTAKKKKRNNKRDEESEDDATDTTTIASGSVGTASKNQKLEAEKEARRKICEQKIREFSLELQQDRPKKEKASERPLTEKNIESNAKHKLFKIQKFTHGDIIKGTNPPQTKLESDAEWLLGYMSPKYMDGFDEFPELRDEFVEWWVRGYKDLIRKGINGRHNDIRSRILDIFALVEDGAGADKWNPHNLPEKGDEMKDLLFRKGMGTKAANREAKLESLASVVDLLLPRVRNSGSSGWQFGGSCVQVQSILTNIPMLCFCFRLPVISFGGRRPDTRKTRPCVMP